MAVSNGTAGMSSTDAADYTRAVLDIAIRVTEVLFTNGAGAEDAVAASTSRILQKVFI